MPDCLSLEQKPKNIGSQKTKKPQKVVILVDTNSFFGTIKMVTVFAGI